MEAGREDTRRDVIATFAILALFVALVSGRAVWRRLARHPSAERCAAMLDRYAEQQNRAYERVPSRTAAPRALDAPDVVRCTRDLTDDEVECALAAGYADELERCLPP
jgi:hypothetical protein